MTRRRIPLITAGLLLLTAVVFAQEPTHATITKTFRMTSIYEAETAKNLVTAFEPGFTKKAGGNLFTAKFGRDKFRYEFDGEWIEFEPQGQGTIQLTAAANELYYENYWQDTDIQFTVRDYGVKVDMVLKTDRAPREFSFRKTQSKGWRDSWIRPAFAYDAGQAAVKVYTIETADLLTYELLADLKGYTFPIVLDPTFDLGNSIDDTDAITQDINVNRYTKAWVSFGRDGIPGQYYADAFLRFALTLPRASKISAANFSVKAYFSTSNAFTSPIYGLAKDNKWETSNGFNTTSYATGTALQAISLLTSTVNWTPAAWTANTWYDSPNIASIVQDCVDLDDYDPLNIEDKYVGFRVLYATGSGWAGYYRAFYSYDTSAANAAELDLTFEPWAQVRVGNGYKYDSAAGVYKWFDNP